jgi:hypothetical protein
VLEVKKQLLYHLAEVAEEEHQGLLERLEEVVEHLEVVEEEERLEVVEEEVGEQH